MEGALQAFAWVTLCASKLLPDSDDLVKVEAAYALARLEIPEGKEALIECLGYALGAYLCPAIAAGYLAKLGSLQGYQTVVRGFEEDNLILRMLACKQLFFFLPYDGQEDEEGNVIDVFQQFDRALRDSDSSIQWQALVQLREIRSSKSRPVLQSYVEDTQDEGSKNMAQRILESIEEGSIS